MTLVATLHGLTIASPELQLTRGPDDRPPRGLRRPARAGALAAGGARRGRRSPARRCSTLEDEEPGQALTDGREVLEDLLRALRLFGDGRVTLGALAWARLGRRRLERRSRSAAAGARTGCCVVTPEQEDELRAFCNLVSRRAPDGNELAWALRRFELGCERASPYEALSDHLLALRALLEPEGPASGLLAGRLAALCATRENRLDADRADRAGASRSSARSIAGTAAEHAGGEALARDVADHLRALLRDVICGHLDPDLAGLADEILLERDDARPRIAERRARRPQRSRCSAILGEAQEVLDLLV